MIVLATELNALLVAQTRSGQSYLKKYDELATNPPKPTPEPTKPSTTCGEAEGASVRQGPPKGQSRRNFNTLAL